MVESGLVVGLEVEAAAAVRFVPVDQDGSQGPVWGPQKMAWVSSSDPGSWYVYGQGERLASASS